MRGEKWYNVEIFDSKIEYALRNFLKRENIKHETSGVCGGVHFEVFCNAMQAERINCFLDKIVENPFTAFYGI